MSTLLEKIAAKKAAQLAAEAVMTEATKGVESPTANAEPIEEPAPSVPEGKPLSFAEKMLLKKQQASHTEVAQVTLSTAPATTASTTSTNSANSTEPSPAPMPAELVIKVVAAVAEEDEHSEAIEKASPADQQAYADIKAKLALLSDMSDEHLKSAMTDLKKALLQNPQACYLMLPQDIGQMVIALRTMKNEAVVEATKEPKAKAAKAKASKPLTADEIAAAFDEL